MLIALAACRKEPVPQEAKITSVDAARAPCSGNDPPPPKTQLEGWPTKKISELTIDGGRFDTEGVVTFSFVPIPCPEGATCKPQMSSHVQLRETKDAKDALVLYTPDPKSIPADVPIRVSAELCPHRGSTQVEGELRGWVKK